MHPQKERRLEDEAELLHFQEQMHISGRKPSASVTRVSRSTLPQDTAPSPPPSSTDLGCNSSILGEIQERPVENTAILLPQLKATPVSFPEAVHRKASKFSLSRKGTTPDEMTSNTSQTTGEAASSIEEENRQLLAAMSPKEIEEAQTELLSRLNPATVEYLTSRARQKKLVQPPAGITAQKPVLQRKGPQAVMDNPISHPSTHLAARIRFNINGAIIEVIDDQAATHPAQDVASRDILRIDEGFVPSGYTLHEALQLSRSTAFQQRLLALRLITAVIKRCRSRHLGFTSGDSCTEELEKAAFTWEDFWRYALHAENLVTSLRATFDESTPPVISAAATALAALVGPTKESTHVLEKADSMPLLCWPAVAVRHMQRQDGASAWIPAPLDLQTVKETEQEEGDDEEQIDEKQLAKIDPLSGLLNMHLLERIVYVLDALQVSSAVEPCLQILLACCHAGKDCAELVLQAKGMVGILKGMDARMSSQVVRSLAQASSKNCSIINDCGLGMHHCPSILSGDIESLRLWRAMALHNQYHFSMEDAFSALVRYFTPPVERWDSTREVFLTAAVICRSTGSNSGMSDQCSKSIAQHALLWLNTYSSIGEGDAALDTCIAAALHNLLAYIHAAGCRVSLIKGALANMEGYIASIQNALVHNQNKQPKAPHLYVLNLAVAVIHLLVALGSLADASRLSQSVMEACLECCMDSDVGETVLLQPWDMVDMQSHKLPVARALLVALRHVQSGATTPPTTKASIAFKLLTLLPPGEEATALDAFAFLYSPDVLQSVLEGAADFDSVPSLETLRLDLRAGWVAGWLGLVPENREDEENISSSGSSHINLPSVAVSMPHGSRLPLPVDWMVKEALLSLPHEANCPTSEPSAAMGCGLFAACRYQALGVIPPQSIKSAVLLVFDRAEEDCWRHPLVKSSLYRLVCESDKVEKWSLVEAQRLSQNFAATSFGDPMFGRCAALMLRRDMASESVQLEALVTLAEGNALHILPSLSECIGDACTYLEPPPVGSTVQNGVQTQNAVDTYLRLVEEGTITWCLESGSMAGDVVLHRFAKMVFTTNVGAEEHETSRKKRSALLNKIIHRCSPEKYALVIGMLFRWDCDEGRASDVVPKERLDLLAADQDDVRQVLDAL